MPTPSKPIVKTEEFLANLFGMERKDFLKLGAGKMPATMSLVNKPEFWVDAPWRLEPDLKEIPLTFYVRDAEYRPLDYGPWRLTMISIDQLPQVGPWCTLKTLMPADCPGLNSQGVVQRKFVSFSKTLQISGLVNPQRGKTIHLRAVFTISSHPYDETEVLERHLEVYLAERGLPVGRVEARSSPRKWFYGDTHYHSSYTSDIKEYGGSIPETRIAGQAIGLDWLVVTDHSCDLIAIDADYPGKTRWERLRDELSSSKISDEHFRFILGEEITLVGHGERYVHMLAMGGMQDMVEGAFLPDDSSSLYVDFWINTIKEIVSRGKGYPPDVLQSLFGKLYSLNEVLDKLPKDTLTFAAHPYDIAQVPPSKWDEDDLAHNRLTGHEFWNARSRRKAGKTDNPFITEGWSDKNILRKSDESRRRKLMQRVNDKWEPHLVQGVEEWIDPKHPPSRRPVFVGGSDAHGDFNYHAGWAWDYTDANMIDDNAIGRVRTVVFVPEHQTGKVPEVETILAALKKGSCVVTDGPIIEFSLHQDGQVAHMGEVLLVDGHTEPVLHIKVHTTEEFGPEKQVEVVTYFKGQENNQPDHVIVKEGKTKAIAMNGLRGYCRLQAQSEGVSGERFNCYTNPIWVWLADGAKKFLHISFSG